MRYLNKFKTLAIINLMAITGFHCSDSGNDASSDSATINGRVSETNGKAVNAENTVVSAAYVTADGSINTINGTEVETDATGSFELAVDAESYQHIVVMAQNSANTYYGYVSGELENQSSYTIKPLDVESSAETKVFAELVSSGEAAMVYKAEIEAAISSETAATVNSSSSAAASIATSLANSAKVRAEYFQDEFGSEAETKSNIVAQAMVDAQTELESKLNAASSTEARAQAYTEFRTNVIDAFSSADIQASNTAKVLEIWGRVALNSMSNVSDEIKSEVYTELSIIVASAIDIAVQEQTQGMDQSTQDAVVQAGITLDSNLRTSVTTVAEVRAAFQNYHDEVRTALENDSNVNASVVIEIDSEINSNNGAKSTFESSIVTSISTSIVLDIYNSFYTAIESTVDSNTSTGNANAEVLTEIMILINLMS